VCPNAWTEHDSEDQQSAAFLLLIAISHSPTGAGGMAEVYGDTKVDNRGK